MIKFDYDSIAEVEEKENLICIHRIRRDNWGAYLRLLKNESIKRVERVIKDSFGRDRSTLFISAEDYEKLDIRKVEKIKRKFKGRPFKECYSCENFSFCSDEIPCKIRDKARARRAQIEVVKGDNRFLKNGKPKKGLVLCYSSRYLYRHTGAKKGECQKENCQFYQEGICQILDFRGMI